MFIVPEDNICFSNITVGNQNFIIKRWQPAYIYHADIIVALKYQRAANMSQIV